MTFEVVMLVMNACLCVVFVCATVMAVFLLYAGIRKILKEFKHNEQPIGDHFYDPYNDYP